MLPLLSLSLSLSTPVLEEEELVLNEVVEVVVIQQQLPLEGEEEEE